MCNRDAQGRKLTPKEAFRQQSYVFHGKKPGKLKQEKRLSELDQMAGGGKMSALEALQKQHAARGQAHVVWSQKKA